MQGHRYVVNEHTLRENTMTHSKPPLIISSSDIERLDAMLESVSDDSFPGKEALEAELARATIVAPQDMPPDVVTMHSTVFFETRPGGKTFELTLVYPGGAAPDAAAREGRISILAPVGGALLGLSVGDEIEWPLPGGNMVRVFIKKVVYQPERAGQHAR
ncbi:MAG: nucleoside diphosphate kinase regulator [Desulfovibrio sp.]|nr:nucleoside diphosphate kinase regulator [Desulfovibrio sp.]